MRVQNNQFQLPKYIKPGISRSSKSLPLQPITFSAKSSFNQYFQKAQKIRE